MGAVNCCAQTTTADDAWKSGEPERILSKDKARELMPMYDYEPSLSLNLDDHASSMEGANFPQTPDSVASPRELEDKSVVIVAANGDLEIHEEIEEQEDLSPEARALLPAPKSCPRSGLNLRGRQPFDSNASPASIPLGTQSCDEASHPPRLEDYLCTCKHCPRAQTIQRAFQLYGFALDHPHSAALLRVLRACANYDERIVEVDPILVLHAEKMLEELDFDENETFRLLVVSHFKRS